MILGIVIIQRCVLDAVVKCLKLLTGLCKYSSGKVLNFLPLNVLTNDHFMDRNDDYLRRANIPIDAQIMKDLLSEPTS